MSLDWSDPDEIGYQLAHAHLEIDPLSLRFTDLHRMILGLDEFGGGADSSNEGVLEAIQMAWYDTWRDLHEP